MITINNITTDQASTEAALAVGCIDHDNPEVVTSVSIDFNELTASQKVIYADFFALGNGRGWVNIDYDCVIGIDHITSEIVISETLELDYNTMSTDDKAKVDSFRELLDQINESQIPE